MVSWEGGGQGFCDENKYVRWVKKSVTKLLMNFWFFFIVSGSLFIFVSLGSHVQSATSPRGGISCSRWVDHFIIFKIIQCPLLNRITLGQPKSDNNNQLIQLTDGFLYYLGRIVTAISDYNKGLIPLSMIQLSGGDCNTNIYMLYILYIIRHVCYVYKICLGPICLVL